MLRGLERRLARAEAGAGEIAEERDAEHAREASLRFRESMVEAIRAGLIRAGLDPADAACLKRPAKPPAPPPPSPSGDDDLAWLEAKFARYAERARDHPPDLADASMAELFAVYGMDDAGDVEAAEG